MESIKITDIINKGIFFLKEHQLNNGEFISYLSGFLESKNSDVIYPDRNIFTTALICNSLTFIKGDDSLKIQDRCLSFLKGEINYGGIWNFYTENHNLRNYVPCDLDDTALVSILFKNRNIEFNSKSNVPFFLANRNSSGLFYTWIVLRIKWVTFLSYWRVTLLEILQPIKSNLIWFKTNSNRNDIDGAVNANVLYYLGECEETKPIINYLNIIILENKESTCDKWYNSIFVVYYFFTRNYFAGIKTLEPIKEPIIIRILAKIQDNGCIGENVLDTATAICSLINLGYRGDLYEKSILYIINNQNINGSWLSVNISFGSSKKSKVGWGSDELTTAFCLEALNRYNDFNEKCFE
jgi:hypothetical protein